MLPDIAAGNAPPADHVIPPSIEYAFTVVLELTATIDVAIVLAVPDPAPAAVATNIVPIEFDVEPIAVNAVLPTVRIW